MVPSADKEDTKPTKKIASVASDGKPTLGSFPYDALKLWIGLMTSMMSTASAMGPMMSSMGL